MSPLLHRAIRLTITVEELDVLLNALGDYADWCGESAADKRWEAEQCKQPFDANGLDAEADHYENQLTTTRALIERLR